MVEFRLCQSMPCPANHSINITSTSSIKNTSTKRQRVVSPIRTTRLRVVLVLLPALLCVFASSRLRVKPFSPTLSTTPSKDGTTNNQHSIPRTTRLRIVLVLLPALLCVFASPRDTIPRNFNDYAGSLANLYRFLSLRIKIAPLDAAGEPRKISSSNVCV